MSVLVAQSLGVRFQSIPEGCIKTPKAFSKLAANRGFKIWWDQADCLQSPLPLAIEPFGRLRFAAADQTLLWSLLSNSGSHPNLPLQNQKNPPEGGSLILVGPGGLFRARLPRAFSPLRGAAAALWRPKCSRSCILSNRCRRPHPTRPPKNQKAPLSRGSFGFGRTRRINQNAIASRVLTLRVSSQATPCKSLLGS